ncbi:serine proteinase stubble-like isoform X1 [Aphis gossypii]|nr:serine proteinase stubble-like isoform X1 [Aphis gossypii]XP_027840205.1 serine proteinase stubble-like isoform X1 [Aphis gossypii]XP_027840206.1 serine proteinase stubble-like isoform X1 [Aphis gossypii]XP_027840207.1 serine proteinase stubble-like isoform X1 [Aphis gossypii]XP_027840208.1 serine proteinase stubble-like isoform X1 [Aphis gossypii]XP_027840209.1 serine proteinase stubble-like isoform X1 [Aphis gossypii]
MQPLPICGLLLFACMLLASLSSAAHPPSPCPDTFVYEGSEPENNRWYGEISLRTDESLVGIRLDVELDRPADLMVSWMGEITTNDNMKFTVLNLNQKLKPGPPVLSRIMVKFNRSTGSPKLRFIRLNGRKICPEDLNYSSGYGEESRPSQRPPQSTRRPDPEFGADPDEYPANSGSTNHHDKNTYPVNGVTNNHRDKDNPVRPGSDYSPQDNRPTTTEGLYTTRKPSRGTTSTTTTPPRNPYEQGNINGNGNGNGNRPNTVTLQASSTDTNSDINGVINELLQNQNSRNKTVIITVIDENHNNRPNGGTDGGSATRPNVSNNRPSSQQTSQKPNSNQQINNGGTSGSYTGSVNSLSSSGPSCGEVKMAVPLVTAGQSTYRGQWPWHVALYLIEGINLSYHCGGSLVSKNKVITAAHCVTQKLNDAVLNSTKIVVYLGKYHQLQYSDELGVQIKQVVRIKVYPSYNSSSYYGDIAMLTLSSDAELTSYVTPVCLWEERSDSLDDIVDKDGTVVGWGFDENNTPTEELKMAKMPVVSQETCLWSYPQFYSEFTSDRTFCAGFRNGTSVCNGDSGGGMVFVRNHRWYLRGIVSLTVAKDGLRVCDTKHYVVFTDVAKYSDFVRKNL